MNIFKRILQWLFGKRTKPTNHAATSLSSRRDKGVRVNTMSDYNRADRRALAKKEGKPMNYYPPRSYNIGIGSYKHKQMMRDPVLRNRWIRKHLKQKYGYT